LQLFFEPLERRAPKQAELIQTLDKLRDLVHRAVKLLSNVLDRMSPLKMLQFAQYLRGQDHHLGADHGWVTKADELLAVLDHWDRLDRSNMRSADVLGK
jgi:hypothetical protein